MNLVRKITVIVLFWVLAFHGESQVIDLGSLKAGDFDSATKVQLTEQLKEARIIVLGEQTHGIAEEYQSFGRMVKFLHEELGFNVLVQEYCFFSTHRVNEGLKQRASAQELRKTMYWPQGKAKEYDLLFDYLDAQQKANNAISVEGFDSRISNREGVKNWIKEIVKITPSYYNDSEKPAELLETIERVVDLEYRDTLTSKAEMEDVLNYFNFLIDYSSSVNKNQRNVQQLKSLRAFCKNAWNSEGYASNDIRRFHHRERQMAENLIWLVDSVYANQKVIVHMHNGHAARNISFFQNYTNDTSGLTQITVGDILDKKHGDECMIIGTTTYQGTHCKWDYKPISIPKPHDQSFEANLHKKELKWALVPLSDYSQEPFYLFFNEFNNWKDPPEIKFSYGQLFDAMIYFDQVQMPTPQEK